MLSNHNTKLINDLYKDFNIHIIKAQRNINANGKKKRKSRRSNNNKLLRSSCL